uniref:Immunoglobulin V-set domain-containing protein n=1 Tax=Dicentrarchus labrax TaxID=13489 RepID=A0A8P4G102_DICLA
CWLPCAVISLSCVSSAAGLIHLFGYEGRDVNVSCPYGEGYESYEKYLCRNDCGNDDVLITTTGAAKNKYSIHDDQKKRVLTATISDLSSTDAGNYRCGVTITGYDIYPAEVKVEVKQGKVIKRAADPIQSNPTLFVKHFKTTKVDQSAVQENK